MRRFLRGLAVATLAIGAVATWALAAGPGGWDHLGDGGGTPVVDSLNAVASSLAVAPGALYVGGEFTDAGGVANADRIAKWNGSSWSALAADRERSGLRHRGVGRQGLRRGQLHERGW